MKRIFVILVILGGQLSFSLNAFSQHGLDSILAKVSSNNKSIIAYNQFLEARKTEYKTGLFLKNPTVELDYMKGTPATAGNQTDITAVQFFDFPTVYTRRKELSDVNIEQLEMLANGYKQDILLEAKLIYLELIYLNKLNNQLIKRKKNAKLMHKAMLGNFEKGGASILDVNKAKINLASIQSGLRLAESEIGAATQKLIELNGGIMVAVSDTLYPLTETGASFETILGEAINGDYTLQSIQQNQQISQKEEQLNKALALPKIEGGYRYQSILGQKFNGFHAGISVPLFENKNRVQAAKQQTLYYSLLEESHMNEYHNELEALFNKSQSLKQSMEEYSELFSDVNSEELLTKAFQLGEISSIEYFMELTYYHKVYDDFLKLEREYYLALSELKKYAL